MHSLQIKHTGLAFAADGKIKRYLSIHVWLNRWFSFVVLRFGVERDILFRRASQTANTNSEPGSALNYAQYYWLLPRNAQSLGPFPN